MKIKSRSGILIWITAIATIVATVITAVKYSEFDGIGSWLLLLIILAASAAMTSSFIMRNYIFVTEQTITVCFGMTTTVLKTATVTSMRKVKSLIASSSASVKRIEIRYGGGVIYVSPKDEDAFIKTVFSYNPNIEVF